MRALLCALALLAGCEKQSEREELAEDARSQIGSYRAQITQVQTALDQYAVAMAKASLTTCVVVHNTYERTVRPLVQYAADIVPSLDTLIAAHDGGASADLGCTTGVLTAELDAHAGAACQQATIEEVRAEAARHAEALAVLLDEARVRTDEIAVGLETYGLDAGVWMWSAPVCP